MNGLPNPDSPPPEEIARGWGRWLERRVLLPWLDGGRPWPIGNTVEKILVKAAGWPWRALWCGIHSENTPNFASHTYVAEGGLSLGAPGPGWADWPADYKTIIPLRPIWENLLADSAVFAAAWSVVVFGPRRVRVWWRRRNGRCGGCGYDLRGLARGAVCPECGASGKSGRVEEVAA